MNPGKKPQTSQGQSAPALQSFRLSIQTLGPQPYLAFCGFPICFLPSSGKSASLPQCTACWDVLQGLVRLPRTPFSKFGVPQREAGGPCGGRSAKDGPLPFRDTVPARGSATPKPVMQPALLLTKRGGRPYVASWLCVVFISFTVMDL